MTTRDDLADLLETTPCRYGKMSYFKADQVIGASLREYGEWAQRELDLLLRLVQKGDWVVDAGAYIGTHTLAFAQRVGKTGQVLALEPNPCSFEVLTRNITQNRLANVRAECSAVSNKEGVLRLPGSCRDISNNPGGTSLLAEETGPDGDTSGLVSVPVKRLDQYKISHCALLKIDVEGMETLVLEGAQKLLQTLRPLVYAECLSVANGAAMLAFMTARDYTGLLHCELAYNPANFRGNTRDLFGTAREANIIFIPTEKLHEFNKRVGRQVELTPLDTLDDLVIGMLRKPQYKQEVLDRTQAAAVVGNDFWLNLPERRYFERELAERTALVQRLENEIAALRDQVSGRDSLVIQTRQETDSLRQAIAAHQASIRQAQAESSQRGQLIGELQATLKGKDEFLAYLREEAATRETSLDRLRGELAEKENTLRDIQHALAAQESTAGSLRGELRQKEGMLEQVQEALQRQETLAGELHLRLDEREAAIGRLKADLRSKNRHISALSDKVEEAEAHSADLAWKLGREEEKSARLSAQVEQMAKLNELAEKRTNAREAQIKGLEAALQNEQGRNEWLASALQQHQAKEQEFSSKLWEIYGSTAWKLVRRMWQVRLFLFPPGSRRERLGRLGMRALRVLRREGLGAFVRAAFRKLRRQPRREAEVFIQPVPVAEHVATEVVIEQPVSQPVRLEVETYGSLLQKIEAALHHSSYSLAISHDDYLTITAGVQVVIRHEAEVLARERISHIHLYPAETIGGLSDKQNGFLIRVSVDQQSVGSAVSEDVIGVLEALRKKKKNCQSLRIHHLMNWNLGSVSSIITAAQPSVRFLWIHDLYSVCPGYYEKCNEEGFCGLPPLESNACMVCVHLKSRRDSQPRIGEFLQKHGFQFLFPSEAAFEIWKGTYPSLAMRGYVAPLFHLVKSGDVTLLPVTNQRPIRLAFIGRSYAAKGWNVWRKTVEKYKNSAEYELHHIGQVTYVPDMEFPEKYEYVMADPSRPYAMVEALVSRKIDAILLFSNCPETFSLLAYEAAAAGAFILARRGSGNVDDFVRQRRNGKLFDSADGLYEYLADPQKFRDDLRAFHRRTPDRFLMQYDTGIVDKFYRQANSPKSNQG